MWSSLEFYRQIVRPNSDFFLQDIASLSKAFAAISSIDACLNHFVVEKILERDPNAKLGRGPELEMTKTVLSGSEYSLRALRLASEVSKAFRHGTKLKSGEITSNSGEISVEDFSGWSAYLSRADTFGRQVIFESTASVGSNWLENYAMNFRVCSVERIVVDSDVGLKFLLEI